MADTIARTNEPPMDLLGDFGQAVHDASVNDFDITRQLALDFVRTTNRCDHPVPGQHSTVLDDREITEFFADARPLRAGKGHQLRSV